MAKRKIWLSQVRTFRAETSAPLRSIRLMSSSTSPREISEIGRSPKHGSMSFFRYLLACPALPFLLFVSFLLRSSCQRPATASNVLLAA